MANSEPPGVKLPSSAWLFLIAVMLLLATTHTIRLLSGFTMAYPNGAAGGNLAKIITLAMQVIISVGAGIASLFVILSKRYGPKDKHWAYGTVGIIIGFWLR